MQAPPPRLSSDIALFLDFDGTLAEIAPTPDDVSVRRDHIDLIRHVARQLNDAVAVISGRPIATIDRYLHNAVLHVAGISGVERRVGRDVVIRAPFSSHVFDSARTLLKKFASSHSGVSLEDKIFGLALHFRLTPEHADACRNVVDRCAQASDGQLERQDGKMVVELKIKGIGKAEAVESFMQDAPFVGRRPVFVGDDLVDESAFAAVAAAQGLGIIVGDRHDTAATARLRSVGEVYAWLRTLDEQVSV